MSDLADSPGGMDRQALNSCLRQLGLDEGNVCLVHASLSQLGWVNGGGGDSGRCPAGRGRALGDGSLPDANRIGEGWTGVSAIN